MRSEDGRCNGPARMSGHGCQPRATRRQIPCLRTLMRSLTNVSAAVSRAQQGRDAYLKGPIGEVIHGMLLANLEGGG